MPSLSARKFLKEMKKVMNPGVDPNTFEAIKQRREARRKNLLPVPEDINVEKVTFNGVEGELVTSKKKETSKIIYYIHGGSFTNGTIQERRGITFYLARKYGYKVVGCNYRLSPENKWPCHLDDCLNFYKGLLEKYKDHEIILMGESAGGHLCLSLGLKLRDESIKLPKAIICYSPATNFYEKLDSLTRNFDKDPIGAIASTGSLNALVFNKGEDLRNPYVSPFFGDYHNLPKIFFSCSDSEVLCDDSILLYKRLKEEGHDVKIDIKHNLIHAYPMFTMIREARNTIKKSIAFAEK